MRGALVYDREGAKRNEWLIKRLLSCAEERGLDLRLCVAPEIDFDVDFAVVRTIDPDISRTFEEKGVRVFNNAKVSAIANDKWATYNFCRGLNIPVMHTELVRDWSGGFPCVVKSRAGHGGKEVFWVKNEAELSAYPPEYIAQKPCSELGEDMRVYVLGNKVLAAVLRKARTGFKSNFSLGGSAYLAEATDGQREVISRICGGLSPDFIAVDFIRDRGGWVLNEIEDSAGTRMLYALNVCDPAKLYIDYISKNI